VILELPASPNAVPSLLTHRCNAVLLDAVTTVVDTRLKICRLLSQLPDAPPLVAVEWCDRRPAQLVDLTRHGLSACVALNDDPTPLAQALHTVAIGQAAFLVPNALRYPTPGWSRVDATRGSDLNERDLGMLQVLEAGMRYSEAADQLRCGESTVRHHIDNLIRRYGLHTPFRLGTWTASWALARLIPEDE